MRLGAAGLKEQPFRVHGRPLAYVPYASRQAALDFLVHEMSSLSGDDATRLVEKAERRMSRP